MKNALLAFIIALASLLAADNFFSPYLLPDKPMKSMYKIKVKTTKTSKGMKKEPTKEKKQEDKTKKEKEKKKFIPLRNPNRAMLQGLVLPGWGQWYNDKKVKAGIFFGIECFLIGSVTYYAMRAHDNYVLSVQAKEAGNTTQTKYYYDRYVSFYRKREDFIWYLATWALVSMADAYVDAYLHGFDSDVDIGIYDKQPKLKIGFDNGLKLGLSFPF